MTDFRSRSLLWVVLRADLILVLVAGFAISFGIDREHALKQHPVGTVIWREFADAQGNKKHHLSKVFDYKSLYWRVRYTDGDWEELNEREILKARRAGNSQSGSP